MRADALLFHDDFRITPYWWDAAPPETSRVALPSSVDLVIVGSGYCGLSAAAEAARQGTTVAVLDAAEIGAGGSTRSGGMVSSGQKLALTDAIRGVSAERLGRLMSESSASFDYLKHLITSESLDADLQATLQRLAADGVIGRDVSARRPAATGRTRPRPLRPVSDIISDHRG